jgi:hypothetical protein
MDAKCDELPPIDDLRALAPIETAAQLLKLPADEIRARASEAGLLVTHPRGPLVRLRDAAMLFEPPKRSRGRPRTRPKPIEAPRKAKRPRTPLQYAPEGAELMPIDEVATLLGVTRDDLFYANSHGTRPRPPLYRIRRKGAFGGWIYPREATLQWIEEHGEEVRAIFADKKRWQAERWKKPMVATATVDDAIKKSAELGPAL